MKLLISTLTRIVVDRDKVVHVRAENDTGAFGILEHQEDLLTALAVSVLSWREIDGKEGHCAVRGGVLTVRGGHEVSVATREAVVSDNLEQLEHDVLKRLRRTRADEAATRAAIERLQIAAMRQMIGYLRPDLGSRRPARPLPVGGPAS
jgi:F-type H+-transporting ATPase subunit epsilon